MKRWIWNIVCGVSLAICIAASVVGPASFRLWTLVALKRDRQSIGIVFAQGEVRFQLISVYPDFPLDEKSMGWATWSGAAPAHRWRWDPPEASVWNRLGFGYFFTDWPRTEQFRCVYVPLWSVWLASLPLAIVGVRRGRRWVRLRQQARRRRAGLCPGCGYDIRATTQRCPECGMGVKESGGSGRGAGEDHHLRGEGGE